MIVDVEEGRDSEQEHEHGQPGGGGESTEEGEKATKISSREFDKERNSGIEYIFTLWKAIKETLDNALLGRRSEQAPTFFFVKIWTFVLEIKPKYF